MADTQNTASAANAADTQKISAVSKITMKAVGANPKAVPGLPEGQNRLLICTVGGFVNGITPKEDARTGKVFYPLNGSFEALHPETGKRTRSGVLYLPEGPHEMVIAQTQAAAKEGTLPLRIKYAVYAVKSSAPLGYSWECEDMMPPAETRDALAELMGTAAPKALPAPSPEPDHAEGASHEAPAHDTEGDGAHRAGTRRGGKDKG